MKIIYIIVGLIIVGGLTFYLTSCNSKQSNKNQDTTSEKADNNPKVYHTKENTFEGLRNMAFSITPQKLELSLLTDKTIVYGVIVDWGMKGATATTVAYKTGDASLYLSSGGGAIGGGQHSNVSKAAKQLVSIGQSFLDKATKTQTTTLPKTDQVKFYLLTNKGIYVGQDVMKNFENNTSEWQKLFEETNKVLTELRLTTDGK